MQCAKGLESSCASHSVNPQREQQADLTKTLQCLNKGIAGQVLKQLARNGSKHCKMIANVLYLLHEVKSVSKTARNQL
jgi:hypothetical protein